MKQNDEESQLSNSGEDSGVLGCVFLLIMIPIIVFGNTWRCSPKDNSPDGNGAVLECNNSQCEDSASEDMPSWIESHVQQHTDESERLIAEDKMEMEED